MLFGTPKRSSEVFRFREHLGGTLEEIPCGVSLGIRDNSASLVKKVAQELREGYQRIKLKVKPGKDYEFVAAVRHEFPDILLVRGRQLGICIGGCRTF